MGNQAAERGLIVELDNLKVRLRQYLSVGLVTVIGSSISCAVGLTGMQALADHLWDSGPGLSADDHASWAIGQRLDGQTTEAAHCDKKDQ